MIGSMAEQEPSAAAVNAPGVQIVRGGGKPPTEDGTQSVSKGTRVRYCYRPNGFPSPVTTTATIVKVYKPKQGDRDQRRRADLEVVMPCGRSGAPEIRERERVVEQAPSVNARGKLAATPNSWWPEPEKPKGDKEQPAGGNAGG